MRNVVTFPFIDNLNSYYGTIQSMLMDRYNVIDYRKYKEGFFSNDDIDIIYLNWIEDYMDEYDQQLLLEAIQKGISIIWVFHNKISHDYQKHEKCKNNLLFLVKNVTRIVVLSHESIKELRSYDENLDTQKIYYLPHQEFINNYGNLVDKDLKDKLHMEKFRFAAICSIREDKNAVELVKAFNRMKYRDYCQLIIAGNCRSKEYYEQLLKEKGEESDIIVIPKWISDYQLDYYIRSADVQVMPYDVDTCLNSGAMLLAFSNKRTVITTNIAMAYEFDDSLIYRYEYTDEKDHVEQLIKQMELAYENGRDEIRKKGEKLFSYICENNSKEIVRSRLYELFDNMGNEFVHDKICENKIKVEHALFVQGLRCNVIDRFINDCNSGEQMIKWLREYPGEIAIYGYGKYGRYICNELQKKGVKISCVIDQRLSSIDSNLPLYSLDTLMVPLDLVLVTAPVTNYEQIRKACAKYNENCYVTSYKDF